MNETLTRSRELLTLAAESADVTKSILSRAQSDYRALTHDVTSLAADVAVIDDYNTSAHQVRYNQSINQSINQSKVYTVCRSAAIAAHNRRRFRFSGLIPYFVGASE